jgi:6-pyruvoyltetrahydropterin/6-carboxytetrahydropterin synthase
MHGHNYKLLVSVKGELDDRGFVMDFAELDAIVNPLIKQVDHKVLNEVAGLENPTAELIAAWFLEKIPASFAVRIYENDDCYAEVVRY